MNELVRRLANDDAAFHELELCIEKLRSNDSTPSPPIESQAKHNNQKVNWSTCTDKYLVDERTFRNYCSANCDRVLRHESDI